MDGIIHFPCKVGARGGGDFLQSFGYHRLIWVDFSQNFFVPTSPRGREIAVKNFNVKDNQKSGIRIKNTENQLFRRGRIKKIDEKIDTIYKNKRFRVQFWRENFENFGFKSEF